MRTGCAGQLAVITVPQQGRDPARQVLAHLDHAIVGRVDQVDGQTADVAQDLPALYEVDVGIGTGCHRVPQPLTVFLRRTLGRRAGQGRAKLTKVRVDGDASHRTRRVGPGYGIHHM